MHSKSEPPRRSSVNVAIVALLVLSIFIGTVACDQSVSSKTQRSSPTLQSSTTPGTACGSSNEALAANPNTIKISQSGTYQDLTTLEKASLLLSNGRNLDSAHQALYESMMLALRLTGVLYSDSGNPVAPGTLLPGSIGLSYSFPYKTLTVSIVGVINKLCPSDLNNPVGSAYVASVLMLIQKGGSNYILLFQAQPGDRIVYNPLDYNANLDVTYMPGRPGLTAVTFARFVEEDTSLDMIALVTPILTTKEFKQQTSAWQEIYTRFYALLDFVENPANQRSALPIGVYDLAKFSSSQTSFDAGFTPIIIAVKK